MDGIFLRNNHGNTIQGNYIGTDVLGQNALGNEGSGITSITSSENLIGGISRSTTSTEHNIISGNKQNGIILIQGIENIIQGNYLGTDASGTKDLGNGFSGIQIASSSNNMVSGKNLISGNTGPGVVIINPESENNVVQGNYIGTDVSGKIAIGNENGVLISDSVTNTIGVSSSTSSIAIEDQRNIISANNFDGISVQILSDENDTGSNTIKGNYIGTDISGKNDLGNGGDGIRLFNSPYTVIGSAQTADRNIISANMENGISIFHLNSTNVVISGNYIGTDIDVQMDLGNSLDGIYIQNTSNTRIGGVEGEQSNIISGNDGNGVTVTGIDAVDNNIRGNIIYNNAKLPIDLGNDGATPNDYSRTSISSSEDDDADVGPNSLLNTPAGINSLYNASSDETLISGFLDTSNPESSIIDIYSQPLVLSFSQASEQQSPAYLGVAKPNLEGAFYKSVKGEITTPVYGVATSKNGEGSTSEVQFSCGGDKEADKDTDGDSLCDKWETDGIDYNHDGKPDFSLRAWGANPMHKDIFVEIDYMEGHRPESAIMQIVENAFANAPVSNPDDRSGINLHLQIDDSGQKIPETSVVIFHADKRRDDPLIGNPNSFKYLKNKYFGTETERASPEDVRAKRFAYHYALYVPTTNREVEGMGEVWGDDFVIVYQSPGWIAKIFQNFGEIHVSKAFTFMHELGHNLGLQHGGSVSIPNCKPNHLSVMNYIFSNPYLTDEFDIKRTLDYSRSKLLPLNQAKLSEPAGVSTSSPPGLYTMYGYENTPLFPFLSKDKQTSAITGGPIDWNMKNGIETTPVRSLINRMGSYDACNGDNNHDNNIDFRDLITLEGHDDWSNLKYNFRDPKAHFSPPSPTQVANVAPIELTADELYDTLLLSPKRIPRAISQNITINENIPTNITLTGIDPFTNNTSTLTFSAITSPKNGILGDLKSVNLTAATTLYTPNPDFIGNDNFTFAIDSGRVNSKGEAVESIPGLVNITVIESTNGSQPIANATVSPSITVTPGTFVTLDGTSSSDPDGGTITSYLWQQTSGPPVTLNSTNSAITSFTAPSVIEDTQLTFTLSVTASDGDQSTASLNVFVRSNTNQLITAAKDTSTTTEDTPVTIDVLANDSITGGSGTLNITEISAAPKNGTASIIFGSNQENENNSTSAIIYTPNPNFFGIDTLDYLVSDDSNITNNDTATVTVNVMPVNDPPTIDNTQPQNITIDEDDNSKLITLTGVNDVDSGDTLTYSIIAKATHGGVQIVNQSNGTVSYSPFANYNGPDGFSFRVNDGNEDSINNGILSIVVNPVNDRPVANNNSQLTTNVNEPIDITLRGTDIDGASEVLSFNIVSEPTFGNLTEAVRINNTAASTTYTPNPQFFGNDNFGFNANDGIVNSTNTALVSITVNNEDDNQPPVANAGADFAVDENTTGIMLNGTASHDPDIGDSISSYNWVQTEGSLVILQGTNTATPSFTAPPITEDTVLRFNLTVADSNGLTSINPDSIAVTVRNIDGNIDLPPIAIITPENQTVDENTTGVKLSGTSSYDPDDEDGTTTRINSSNSSGVASSVSILSYSWQQTSGPPVRLNSTTSAEVQFNAPSVTADTQLAFSLSITDNEGTSSVSADTASVLVKNLNVNINIPPIANAGPDQVVDENTTNIKLDGSGSQDDDGTLTSYNWTQINGSPVVTLEGADTATPSFTAPSVDTNTTLTFALTVTDNDGVISTTADTTNILIKDFDNGNVNQPPIAKASVFPSTTVNRGSIVILDGSSSIDPDGGRISLYKWEQTSPETPTINLYRSNTARAIFIAPLSLTANTTFTFTLTVTDSDGSDAFTSVNVLVLKNRTFLPFPPFPTNQPPDANRAIPSRFILWPANHEMVEIRILNVIDLNRDPVTIEITNITQDEPVDGLGNWDTAPDGNGIGSNIAHVRSERANEGDGRVYHIYFTASDGKQGGQSNGEVTVSVLNEKSGKRPIDSGSTYDSTLKTSSVDTTPPAIVSTTPR